MKKSGKARAKARKSQKPQEVAPASADRRKTLTLIRNGAIGAVVLGGAGVFSVNAVRATVAEQDLTKIGNGTPSIVQIHDPTCAMCTELQRETRKALRAFDKDAVNYLVANIHSDEGSAFAARHRVQHVTLVLLDGDGQVRQILEGVRQRDELRAHFAAHLTPGS
ncbi:MAG: hypothetical protein AAFQ79_18535 [Pseudomonadota bacterium]